VIVAGASTHPGKFGFVALHNILSSGTRPRRCDESDATPVSVLRRRAPSTNCPMGPGPRVRVHARERERRSVARLRPARRARRVPDGADDLRRAGTAIVPRRAGRPAVRARTAGAASWCSHDSGGAALPDPALRQERGAHAAPGAGAQQIDVRARGRAHEHEVPGPIGQFVDGARRLNTEHGRGVEIRRTDAAAVPDDKMLCRATKPNLPGWVDAPATITPRGSKSARNASSETRTSGSAPRSTRLDSAVSSISTRASTATACRRRRSAD